MRLYVGNLPFTATEDDVRNFFAPTAVGRIVLCTDRETGRPRGFGFVEIADASEAERAIAERNGTDLGGRRILVNEAIEKPRGSRPEESRGRADRERDRPRERNRGGGSRRRRDSDY